MSHLVPLLEFNHSCDFFAGELHQAKLSPKQESDNRPTRHKIAWLAPCGPEFYFQTRYDPLNVHFKQRASTAATPVYVEPNEWVRNCLPSFLDRLRSLLSGNECWSFVFVGWNCRGDRSRDRRRDCHPSHQIGERFPNRWRNRALLRHSTDSYLHCPEPTPHPRATWILRSRYIALPKYHSTNQISLVLAGLEHSTPLASA